MSDQDFRFALSTVFNLPVIVLAWWYVWRSGGAYRHFRDARSLQGMLVAFGLFFGYLAYWTLAMGLIAVNAPPIPREFRIAIFACRVIVFAVLVVALWRSRGEH